MYPQTLYPKTKQVLNDLKVQSLLKDFYLAGGTALALQIGHRRSIDLDFFTNNFPEREILMQKLKMFKPKITQEVPGTLDILINNVKVSFLEYKYPLLEPLLEFESVNIADLVDIACMKLTAISSRGSKKDFVDLYFLLNKYPLDQLLTKFERKYKGVKYQKIHILKSLTFFNDADNEPEPDYMQRVDWVEVKSSLENEIKRYLTTQL